MSEIPPPPLANQPLPEVEAGQHRMDDQNRRLDVIAVDDDHVAVRWDSGHRAWLDLHTVIHNTRVIPRSPLSQPKVLYANDVGMMSTEQAEVGIPQWVVTLSPTGPESGVYRVQEL
jgi:hypothetical protein